jgi:flagella basal body P-ring formation protein FlgA
MFCSTRGFLKFVILSAAVFVLMDTSIFAEKMEGKALRIYLPREMVVKGETIELSQIGILQGDGGVVEKAGRIGLGRFALGGQRIVVDRGTILSRLASEGIRGIEVSISGAENVTVRRHERVISGECFVEAGEKFLRAQAGYSSASIIEPVVMPKDWVLGDGGGQVSLAVKKVKYGNEFKPKVWIGVLEEGVEKGGSEVVFKLTYNCRRAVAEVDIPAGTVISSEHVNVETVQSGVPEPSGWSEPYGLVAKRLIRAGDVVSAKVAGPAAPPILIQRKQQVFLKIDKGGLYISALGEALEDGKVGDYIRVRRGLNRDGRIVMGCVKADGTVEPVF